MHFTELRVWQLSHAMVLEIYRATAPFPISERYALTNQLRRAASSVPTNLAEGSRRISTQEFARFINIAEGSLAEVEYLIRLAHDLQYLPTETGRTLLGRALDIAPQLRSLRRRVSSPVPPTSELQNFRTSEPHSSAEPQTPAVQIDGAQ